jgi:carbamate kinase
MVRDHGWTIAPDGDRFRRVVASPQPQRIFELRPIQQLLEKGTVVVCAGGGGIPTAYDEKGRLHGVEAVIDKDLASSLLAQQLDADLLVIATDVDGVYDRWATPDQRRLDDVTPEDLDRLVLPAGSMGPKVRAAGEFAQATGRRAVIGSLTDIADLVTGACGTNVRPDPALLAQ